MGMGVADGAEVPRRASLVLLALVGAAGAVGLSFGVANVALPRIAADLGADQGTLNLIATAFSMGMAASVLGVSAFGDRIDPRKLLLGGLTVSMAAAVLAATAPNPWVLIAARALGGVGAALVFPTTLAMITRLWSGASTGRAIGIWTGFSSAVASLGPLCAGVVLELVSWRVVLAVPGVLSMAALIPVLVVVPPLGGARETAPLDRRGVTLSVVTVAALIAGINLITMPGFGATGVMVVISGLIAAAAFVWSCRRVAVPVLDLAVLRRRLFWVAALSGLLAFGSLAGSMYVGQLYLQNVLGYTPLQAGAASLPAVIALAVLGPLTPTAINRVGSRLVLVGAFAGLVAAFAVMLLLWDQDSNYPVVGLSYLLVGCGVGCAAPTTIRLLTASAPPGRAAMASATVTLQQDFGGALMQSVFGGILGAGYAAWIMAAVGADPAEPQPDLAADIIAQLRSSYAGATSVAENYPDYAEGVMIAANESFVMGASLVYLAGIAVVAVGAALAWLALPDRRRESELLAAYQLADSPTVIGPRTTHSQSDSN